MQKQRAQIMNFATIRPGLNWFIHLSFRLTGPLSNITCLRVFITPSLKTHDQDGQAE